MKTSPRTVRPNRQPRRGVAMLLVLGVIAVSSVLGWAMLSASSVRARVETTAADGLEAAYQADSGVSYALYYIRYPERSPVPLAPDANGAYTSQQSNLQMWPDARGTTTVTVTTAGDGLFAIRSTAEVDGLTRTTLADAAHTFNRYRVTHAAAFNGPFVVPSNMRINGPVVGRGTVTDLFGRITNSPPIVPAGANVTPPLAELTLQSETAAPAATLRLGNERRYTYDGIEYAADLAPATITGTPVSGNANNPLNVWYAEADTTIHNATLVGTLVVRNGLKLTVTGLNTITAKKPEMPALIAGSVLDMKTTAVASRLTVGGVAWVGREITDSATIRSTGGWLKVNGALLMGDAAPLVNSRYLSQIEVVYDPAVAKIPAMSTVKAVNGVAVRNWRNEGD